MNEIKDIKFATRALTTDEITADYAVEILKQNKKEGRAFAFLPFEAREWAKKNPQEILVYVRKMGNNNYVWIRRGQCDYPLYEDTIYALPDDYEVKKETSGEWVTFDIDQKGNFHCFIDGDMHYLFWANWNVFLTEANSSGYTTFGGWQYENCDTWFMCPMMREKGVSYHNTDRKKDYIGAVPVKIRFWREKCKKLTDNNHKMEEIK